MDRLTILVVMMLAVGCSGDDGNPTNNGTSTNNVTNNDTSTGLGVGLKDRPALVEPAGCLDEAENPAFTPEERDYAMQTGTDVEPARVDYYTSCGSSRKVDIDWLAILSSAGFEEEELDSPGAIQEAMEPFLGAAQDYCFTGATGDFYRNQVALVVFTATEDASRVGLCFDEASSTIVSRFLLTPGDGTVSYWDRSEVETWLDDTLTQE